MKYIREAYGVPAKRGGLIKFEGRPGVIIGSRNGNLKLRVEGTARTFTCHPTWHIEYLSETPTKEKESK